MLPLVIAVIDPALMSPKPLRRLSLMVWNQSRSAIPPCPIGADEREWSASPTARALHSWRAFCRSVASLQVMRDFYPSAYRRIISVCSDTIAFSDICTGRLLKRDTEANGSCYGDWARISACEDGKHARVCLDVSSQSVVLSLLKDGLLRSDI